MKIKDLSCLVVFFVFSTQVALAEMEFPATRQAARDVVEAFGFLITYDAQLRYESHRKKSLVFKKI